MKEKIIRQVKSIMDGIALYDLYYKSRYQAIMLLQTFNDDTFLIS